MSWKTVVGRSLLGTAFLLAATCSASAQQIAGISPALPTSADAISILVARPNCDYTTQGSSVEGTSITLTLDYASNTCPAEPVGFPPDRSAYYQLPPLAPGNYTVVVLTGGVKTDTRPIVVQAPSTSLSLLLEEFTVTVTWTNPFSGTVASANAVQVTDASGYFWFFSSDDVDLTVKMIGAYPTFWFFASSGTNEQFAITVTDTVGNKTVTYSNPSGVNHNIIDFTSFSYR
jgi:hypothetical protein